MNEKASSRRPWTRDLLAQDTIWAVGGGGDESGRQRDAEILFNVQNISFPQDSRGMLFFDLCRRGGLANFPSTHFVRVSACLFVLLPLSKCASVPAFGWGGGAREWQSVRHINAHQAHSSPRHNNPTCKHVKSKVMETNTRLRGSAKEGI